MTEKLLTWTLSLNTNKTFSAVWLGYTLLAILSSLIKFYTNFYSQQSDQGLHCLPFSAVWSSSRSTLSFSGTVWSKSTLFGILSRFIKVYSVCHSQQSNHGRQYLLFSAVWSRATLFAIRSSLIRDYTFCHSQQNDEILHYLPFSV